MIFARLTATGILCVVAVHSLWGRWFASGTLLIEEFGKRRLTRALLYWSWRAINVICELESARVNIEREDTAADSVFSYLVERPAKLGRVVSQLSIIDKLIKLYCCKECLASCPKSLEKLINIISDLAQKGALFVSGGGRSNSGVWVEGKRERFAPDFVGVWIFRYWFFKQISKTFSKVLIEKHCNLDGNQNIFISNFLKTGNSFCSNKFLRIYPT